MVFVRLFLSLFLLFNSVCGGPHARSPLSIPVSGAQKSVYPVSSLSSVSSVTKKGGKKKGDRAVEDTAVTSGLKNALASALSAMTCKLLLQPFDTLKTVQQHSPTAITLGEASQVCWERGGWGGYYRGVGASVLGSFPSVGLYFGVYQGVKKMLQDKFPGPSEDPTDINVGAIVVAAAVGNTVASVARVPYEVVKQRLQAGIYESTGGAIKSMWLAGGVREFYPLNSISVQMLRDVPYAITTLLTYEYLQKKWVAKNKTKGRDMIAGALAGGTGSLLSNPMDVIKTRIQVSTMSYDGIFDCFAKTVNAEGMGAFMKGAKPRLMHKVPANGVFFLCYEFFRRLLGVSG